MPVGLVALAAAQEEWAAVSSHDAQMLAFRRGVDLRLGLSDGDTLVVVTVSPNGVTVGGDADLTLVAPPDAWTHLLSKSPAPHYQHFLAMRMRVDGTRIEGDEISYAQHAHVIRRLLELARELVAGPVPRAADPHIDRSRIVGAYVPVVIEGHTIAVHVERSGGGRGAPIVVLHTAGADGRQAHPLMADATLTARHEVVAFDMPGHGRSEALPEPLGAWTLTPERYSSTILAVLDALALDAPVLLGASMAGEACLMMAHRAPGRLRGVIACEAAEFIPGRVTPWAGHPRVNEAVFVPEWIDGLIAPGAPASMRDLVLRTYSQGGHRTFAGDIDFYSGGWDGRDIVADIDTTACPVVMMTGEYDYSCTPAMSEATARRIRGAHFWTMPGLGHFPICEHPAVFRPHLEQALTMIGATND